MTDMPDLCALAALEGAATPGPWYVRPMDDDFAMCATAIATRPNTSGDNDDLTACSHEIVAATLIQHPRYVMLEDDRSLENAELIVAVRNALPELLRLARLGAAVAEA